MKCMKYKCKEKVELINTTKERKYYECGCGTKFNIPIKKSLLNKKNDK